MEVVDNIRCLERHLQRTTQILSVAFDLDPRPELDRPLLGDDRTNDKPEVGNLRLTCQLGTGNRRQMPTTDGECIAVPCLPIR